MITSVSKTADLLTTPQRGGEPEGAAAMRPTAARMQTDTESTPSQPIDRATLDQAVAKVSEVLKSTDTQVRLEVDQDSDRVIVKVMKEGSGEVIRQIPAKEMVELSKYIANLKGVFLEERA